MTVVSLKMSDEPENFGTGIYLRREKSYNLIDIIFKELLAYLKCYDELSIKVVHTLI